ncbi:translesion error-prone DNA polymerase V autoproteolytic subunit [Buttiauxella noackiae]
MTMAAFPSPAQDYAEKGIDLHELLVKRPAATYFVRASDDSMKEGGIGNGDLLVIDSARTAVHNNIVIAAINGEFVVRQLQLRPVIQLTPLNRSFQPIRLGEEALEIFGVVTYAIKQMS